MEINKIMLTFFNFKYHTYSMKNNFSFKKNSEIKKQEINILENKEILDKINPTSLTFLLLTLKKTYSLKVNVEKLIDEIDSSYNFQIENTEFLKFSSEMINNLKVYK